MANRLKQGFNKARAVTYWALFGSAEITTLGLLTLSFLGRTGIVGEGGHDPLSIGHLGDGAANMAGFVGDHQADGFVETTLGEVGRLTLDALSYPLQVGEAALRLEHAAVDHAAPVADGQDHGIAPEVAGFAVVAAATWAVDTIAAKAGGVPTLVQRIAE